MKQLALFITLICITFTLDAQNLKTPTLSPFSEIKQEVGLTAITIQYARPAAKGRKVFGELVPFGEMWRTGANASTKLIFTEDVKIDGHDLPAGTYALYSIPGQSEWTMIIHKKTNMRSIAGGKVLPENDAFRFKVTPSYLPGLVENFSIQIDDVQTNSCMIELAWEHTEVAFKVEVEVAEKINAQMATLMEQPEEVRHRSLFLAAEYNLHNQGNLDQAQEWIDLALKKSKENPRYGLLKSKIYNAQGNADLAIKTVKLANQWAVAAKNTNYISQTEIYAAGLMGNSDEADTKTTSKYSQDVNDIDRLLTALYASISGEAGEKRDWERFHNLFVDDAKLVPSGRTKDGTMMHRTYSPAQYVATSGSYLEENGFFEKEISREVVAYGSLIHVFSTYESYHSESDAEPFARGINSIQLMKDGDRYYVMQIYWLAETEDNPIPSQFLPK